MNDKFIKYALQENHSAIEISSDVELANISTSGNGSPNNPYIIENWTIQTSEGHAIHIQDTSAYFVIRNCWVETDYNGNGIYIANVSKGTFLLENNSCVNNWNGISIYYCESSKVINNSCFQNYRGIKIYDAQLSLLANNTVSNNSNGIQLSESSNNSVIRNIVYNNSEGGIILTYSTNNTILENTLYRNGLIVGEIWWYWWIDLSAYYQTVVANNTVNGKKLIYWQNIVNTTVPLDTGQVILINCSKVNISSLNLSYVSIALRTVFCNNLSIINNLFSNNREISVHLSESIDITMFNNSFLSGGRGIALDRTHNTVLRANLINGTAEEGIFITGSENNTLDNNTVTFCGGSGIFLDWSENNTLYDNTISSCVESGVYLGRVDNTSLFNNSVLSGGRGITLDNSHSTFLRANLINGTAEVGIAVVDSENNTLSNNTVTLCGENGLWLEESDNNILNHNLISDNEENGLLLAYSTQNTIIGNKLIDNDFQIEYQFDYGWDEPSIEDFLQKQVENNTINDKLLIYWQTMENTTVPDNASKIFLINCSFIEIVDQNFSGLVGLFCSYLNILDNVISNGTGSGIIMYNSFWCNLRNNSLVNQENDGISLYASRFTKLENNIIRKASNRGIYVENCESINISYNQVLDSEYQGVWLQASYDSIISNNTISNSNREGLYIEYSDNSIIFGNIITFNCKMIDYFGSGIRVSADNCEISKNLISDNWFGIYVLGRKNAITQNIITHNRKIGIQLGFARESLITLNTISNHPDFAIYIESGSDGNIIKFNDIVSNLQGSSDRFAQVENIGNNNVFVFNFWNDWIEPDENDDGIVDIPYLLAESKPENADLYPLVFMNPPSTHIITPLILNYPTGGETLSGVVHISWINPHDSFDHSLNFSLYLSVDGGNSWNELITGLSTIYYDWDTINTPNSTNYLIKIAATCSDGLSVETTSDPFTIYNEPVQTTIIDPFSFPTTTSSIPPVEESPDVLVRISILVGIVGSLVIVMKRKRD
jgi:parallel beta-helix repeat protein